MDYIPAVPWDPYHQVDREVPRNPKIQEKGFLNVKNICADGWMDGIFSFTMEFYQMGPFPL